MKKIIIPLFLSLFVFASCGDDFDEMNKSKTSITESSLQAGPLLGRAMYYGSSADHQRNFNLFDDMYAHYLSPMGLGGTNQYVYNAGWGDIFWRDFYTARQREFLEVKTLCEGKDDMKAVSAMNDIWNVIMWLRIVDRNGDAPYKDAEGNYAGMGNTIPYNSQEEIYADLLARLKADSDALSNTDGQLGIDNYDMVYSNDFAKWRKLANTLIMRLSMRVSGTSMAETAKTYYQGAKDLAMSSASDYARISCDSSVWGDYYDRTYYDWANTIPEDCFMSVLNGTNKGYATGVADPRRAIWFEAGDLKSTTGNQWDGYPNGTIENGTDAAVTKAHGGNNSGNSSSYARLNCSTKEGFFFFDFHNSANQNLSWCYATYSETLFLKAEAILRGWDTGDAESVWKQGIRASMDEIAYFITRSGGSTTISSGAYNEYVKALPAFGSSNEEKLRSIAIQKWIALFPNSVEAWSEIRRTGYPGVYDGTVELPMYNSGAQVEKGNIIQRMPYPENELQTNEARMPEDFRSSGSKYQYRTQYGLFWSQAALHHGGTLKATDVPQNF